MALVQPPVPEMSFKHYSFNICLNTSNNRELTLSQAQPIPFLDSSNYWEIFLYQNLLPVVVLPSKSIWNRMTSSSLWPTFGYLKIAIRCLPVCI